MTELTVAQQLLPLKRALGRPVQLRPYEVLLRLKVEPEQISLALRVYETTETTREVRFHKCGIRLRTWKLKDGKWEEELFEDEDGNKRPLPICWDDDFKPFIECRFGHSLTPEEYTDRLEREAMTYRPGTSRTPLDSFERTVAGGPTATTDAMFRYWTGHERALGYTTETDEDD